MVIELEYLPVGKARAHTQKLIDKQRDTAHLGLARPSQKNGGSGTDAILDLSVWNADVMT